MYLKHLKKHSSSSKLSRSFWLLLDKFRKIFKSSAMIRALRDLLIKEDRYIIEFKYEDEVLTGVIERNTLAESKGVTTSRKLENLQKKQLSLEIPIMEYGRNVLINFEKVTSLIIVGSIENSYIKEEILGVDDDIEEYL